MSTSLLDVLVGQRVRLIVSKEDGDPAKGEERSRREVEIIGQLLDLPPLDRTRLFEDHYVHSADGKRHAISNEAVRRIEVLDPASDNVLLFAKCTAETEPSNPWSLGLDHPGAQCCVHEVHVGRGQERQQPRGA